MSKKICIEQKARTFDYKNGAVLSKRELEEYRQKVADRIANNPEKQFAFTNTGNMLTIAYRATNDPNEIVVFQAEGYIQHIYRVEKED